MKTVTKSAAFIVNYFLSFSIQHKQFLFESKTKGAELIVIYAFISHFAIFQLNYEGDSENIFRQNALASAV